MFDFDNLMANFLGRNFHTFLNEKYIAKPEIIEVHKNRIRMEFSSEYKLEDI